MLGRRPASPPRALPGPIFAVLVATLVVATPPSTRAESGREAGEPVSIGQVAEVPLWIEMAGPPRGGAPPQAVVLVASGVAWWVGPGGPLRLASGLLGEQFARCGEALLAVGPRSTLTRFTPAPELGAPSAAGPSVSMLHRPLCLDAGAPPTRRVPVGSALAVDADGELVLVDPDLRSMARSSGLRALPDAEPRVLDLGAAGWAVAVLADPTQRYRAGLLGDEVEAGSVVLLAHPGLEELARWRVPPPGVVEERRALPWRAGDLAGVHVPVSAEGEGTTLVTLVYHPAEADGTAAALRPLAVGPALEPDGGWLHVIAHTTDAASAGRVYAQHHPHAGGPLVRYGFAAEPGDRSTDELDAPAHTVRSSQLEVASHALGERNLDRAAYLGVDADGGDLLALPSSDHTAVAWVRCDADGCAVEAVTELPAALATNLAPALDGAAHLGLLAADAAGGVWWLPVPPAWGR